MSLCLSLMNPDRVSWRVLSGLRLLIQKALPHAAIDGSYVNCKPYFFIDRGHEKEDW